MYWWTPTKDKSIDFKDVKDYILDIRRAGFNIKMVTFDRWNSVDLMMQLRQAGLNSEVLSVAKKHYDDFKIVVAEDRLRGPAIDILVNELLRLRIVRDKIDHPRSGSKDLSDAACGSIFNSVRLSKRDMEPEIEIITWRDRIDYNEADDQNQSDRPGSVIEAPLKMPDELAEFLDRMRII
jgi:hypothetical protein